MESFYTSRGHECDVFEALEIEIESQERGQVRRANSPELAHGLFDSQSELSERRMVAAVTHAAFDELPPSLDHIRVWRVRLQIQQRDSQLLRAGLYDGVVLAAGIIQDQCDGARQSLCRDLGE